ncbi:DUF3750 domain-containing protein [Billgrantia endophytica]|uniref:DUF3750 domain-containing protein n=1 Tax=Billgrantia endophytica TaxID=2033802 RepID=A0A2N7TUA7_9GAMM|nr:DUF3750 domain-containing protein [Halomonas endophytica]PMR71763.1 DUF3750 domain-containing protein [Halomonas endophytica]
MRCLFGIAVILALLGGGPLFMWWLGDIDPRGDWRNADRTSAGLAPDLERTPDAVVQVYSARAFGWRGIFAVHAWVVTKPKGAVEYTVHQVTGWGRPTLSSRTGIPDRAWFGSPPEVHATLCGAPAEQAIEQIEEALPHYPYQDRYRAWPGPNSNTFVAWLIREVPALAVSLPPTAIGKDYLGDRIVAPSPGGTGFQVSLGGYIGGTAGVRDGVEVHLGGLVVGIDPGTLGAKLPGVGTLSLLGARGTNDPAECPPRAAE